MNNTTKILLSVLLFIVCAAIGFGGVRLISSMQNGSSSPSPNAFSSIGGGGGGGSVNGPSSAPSSPISGVTQIGPGAINPENPKNPEQKPDVPDRGGQLGNDKVIGQDAINPDMPKENPDVPDQGGNSLNNNGNNPFERVETGANFEITGISTPVYNESDKTYTFTVQASGNNIQYGLADSNKKKVVEQSSATFKVKGTGTGKYYVYIFNSSGKKSDYLEVSGCVLKVAKITAKELQAVLNSGDSKEAANADFKNRVNVRCKFVFEGRDESEGDAPISYNEILQRIKLKTWSSVTVKSVYHNESGKLYKAVIKVNY